MALYELYTDHRSLSDQMVVRTAPGVKEVVSKAYRGM